jgi:hypothetical protein
VYAGAALCPSPGRGLIVGGAHGIGRVYQNGRYVGDTTVTQVSIGLQVGGQAYRQIIFFEDRRSFEAFTSGNYQFDAGVSAAALKAAASGSAGTTGTTAETSGQSGDATTQRVASARDWLCSRSSTAAPWPKLLWQGKSFPTNPAQAASTAQSRVDTSSSTANVPFGIVTDPSWRLQPEVGVVMSGRLD